MLDHISRQDSQSVFQNWVIAVGLGIQDIHKLAFAVLACIPHLIHLGHSVEVHSLRHFFFSLTAHPLPQHGQDIGGRLQSLQLIGVDAALEGHHIAFLVVHRQQSFTGRIQVGILGQSIHGGFLCDTAGSREAHSKACGLIHTTSSHASILNDALIERSLTHRGVVVGHVHCVE